MHDVIIQRMLGLLVMAMIGVFLAAVFMAVMFTAILAIMHYSFVLKHRSSKTTGEQYVNKYSIHGEYRLAMYKQPMCKSRDEMKLLKPEKLYCFCLDFPDFVRRGVIRDYEFLHDYVQWCVDNTRYQYEFAVSEAISYKYSHKPTRRIWFLFLNEQTALLFKLTYQDQIVEETSVMYSSKNNNYEPE